MSREREEQRQRLRDWIKEKRYLWKEQDKN